MADSRLASVRVINAAGKLTALGGSAQSDKTAKAQKTAAQSHVDLAKLRLMAGSRIAELCEAEAGCVTSGAAAGITISVAALLCHKDETLITQLPKLKEPQSVVLQAGHDINFGASIEQMIHLAGAETVIAGTKSRVEEQDVELALASQPLAFLYVQSHHCLQDNRLGLDECISIARKHKVPVIVDAAAEEDLLRYISAGADLVTYSGGKAFGGPTSGFIVGRETLIDACEHQFSGIARTMKVSKEQLLGLLTALEEYSSRDESAVQNKWQQLNATLINNLASSPVFATSLKTDEAGRDFARVALAPQIGADGPKFTCEELVSFLENSNPSIRTRNHQMREGRVLVDPRELTQQDMHFIIERLNAFADRKINTTLNSTLNTTIT